MKYELWDVISYGHLEPLIPFTKIFESDILNDVIEYVDKHNINQTLFVTSNNGDILFDTSSLFHKTINL
jgi:hypothetical protein